jgi:hypothetical protein
MYSAMVMVVDRRVLSDAIAPLFLREAKWGWSPHRALPLCPVTTTSQN